MKKTNLYIQVFYIYTYVYYKLIDIYSKFNYVIINFLLLLLLFLLFNKKKKKKKKKNKIK